MFKRVKGYCSSAYASRQTGTVESAAGPLRGRHLPALSISEKTMVGSDHTRTRQMSSRPYQILCQAFFIGVHQAFETQGNPSIWPEPSGIARALWFLPAIPPDVFQDPQ